MTQDPDEKDKDKKERVIHTRVPESLEAELRKRSGDLGISVSNLVRNVLGHAFGLVGDVAADATAIARAARGDSKPSTSAPAAAPGEAIAWQTAVLAKNAICATCNAILPKGSGAAIGLVDAGARPILCPACLDEMRSKS